MNGFVMQLGVVAGTLVVCFFGPCLALGFMLWRKRRVRAQRRSPIGIDLLRGPGHSLREQIDDAGTELGFDLALLMIVPLTALTLFLAQGHVLGLSRMMPLAPIFALLTLLFFAWSVRQLLKAGAKLDRLRAGYDAELAVGQALDQLMRRGAVVFHDLPAEHFNIDHVVVAPQGVFAVETKGYTKPNRGKGRADATVSFDGSVLRYPTWTTREPLEQAERQAAWLARWLGSATGAPTVVLPVLAMPGWFVDRTGRGPVRVYSGKELSNLLEARGAQALSEERVRQIAHQIEQRCRTVAPRYAGKTKAS